MQQTEVQIKTTGIDHVVLWVNDLERAKAFYVDLLGMTVNHEGGGNCFLWCGKRPGGPVQDPWRRGDARRH